MPVDPAMTTRKKPTMNSPFATQTQIESRIAARLESPERIRRALRLDNPNMWGDVAHAAPGRADRLPTPTYPATA